MFFFYFGLFNFAKDGFLLQSQYVIKLESQQYCARFCMVLPSVYYCSRLTTHVISEICEK